VAGVVSDGSDDRRRADARRDLIGEKTRTRSPTGSDLAPGTMVDGRYTITGPGLRGGMGVVYPARHVTLGKPRAVKLLHPHLVSDEAAVARFEQEAQLASELDDPSVVRVLDFGEWEDQSYLVMEWVAGGSLRAEMERRAGAPGRRPRLPLDLALPLIRRVTDALVFAHARGVVHLDVTPGNILLAREAGHDDLLHDGGRPKLADFGISKLLGKEDLSRSAAAAGKAGYLAPTAILTSPIVRSNSVGVPTYRDGIDGCVTK
jgi:serine/threonine-protein kinase